MVLIESKSHMQQQHADGAHPSPECTTTASEPQWLEILNRRQDRKGFLQRDVSFEFYHRKVCHAPADARGEFFLFVANFGR